jgi:Kef-type K+ transport system membrane component KefB
VNDGLDILTTWILLVGLAVIASGLIEASFRRLGIPALVGYLASLFVLVPALHDGQSGMWSALAVTGSSFIIKLALFIAVCYLFSQYLEPRLTEFTARLEPAPHRMLTVVGVGFIIAAFANWLGFSLAIGALFVGLLFRRDPQAIRAEKSFTDIYAFAMPFFFINIGLHVSPGQLGVGIGLGLLLLIVAAAGKLIGAGTLACLHQSGGCKFDRRQHGLSRRNFDDRGTPGPTAGRLGHA